MNCIVLNANGMYLNTISWQKAITLVFQDKCDVLAYHDETVSNGKDYEMFLPKLIRLVKMVRQLYRNNVPYSKRNVFTRDKFTCQFCSGKLTLDECTVDHVVPKAKGGKSEWDNCVTACKTCNHGKGDKALGKESGLYLRKKPFTPTINEFIQLKMRALGVDKYINEIFENLY